MLAASAGAGSAPEAPGRRSAGRRAFWSTIKTGPPPLLPPVFSAPPAGGMAPSALDLDPLYCAEQVRAGRGRAARRRPRRSRPNPKIPELNHATPAPVDLFPLFLTPPPPPFLRHR